MRMATGIDEPQQWFVLNAYKCELRAEDMLESRGIKHFVPKKYAIHKNRYGMSRVLVPAIPTLVFARSTYEEIDSLQRSTPLLTFATCKEGDKRRIMKVPDRQMDSFIRVASHYDEDIRYFHPEEISLAKGQRVRIIGGIFDGAEGTLLKVKGIRERRLVVSIDGMLSVAAARIAPKFIEKIEPDYAE